MSKQYISPTVRQRVATFSRYRCGYCQTSQRVIGPFLEIDHIIPESKGGTAAETNLVLACPHCNGQKSDQMAAPDPNSGELTPLFDPRSDIWHEHFQWHKNGSVIIGLSATGRATIDALDMNHPDLVKVRQLWVEAGWHRPDD